MNLESQFTKDKTQRILDWHIDIFGWIVRLKNIKGGEIEWFRFDSKGKNGSFYFVKTKNGKGYIHAEFGE